MDTCFQQERRWRAPFFCNRTTRFFATFYKSALQLERYNDAFTDWPYIIKNAQWSTAKGNCGQVDIIAVAASNYEKVTTCIKSALARCSGTQAIIAKCSLP